MSTKISFTTTVTWTGDTATQIEVRQVTDTPTGDGGTKRSTRRVALFQPYGDNAVHGEDGLREFLWSRNYLTTTKTTRYKDGRIKTMNLAPRFIEPNGTPKGIPVHTPEEPAEAAPTPEETPTDAAGWKLQELDHLTTLIQQNEAALRELYAQRVQKVKDLMHLDKITATEIAGRLGISRRRVYKMIEQPQGPVSEPTPEMF